MIRTIKCKERYKGFEYKELEKRKKWLETRGFNPVINYDPFRAFPYILIWYVDKEKYNKAY